MLGLSLLTVGIIFTGDIALFEVESNIFTRTYELFILLVSLLGVLGLYGFVYQKKKFTPDIWKFIFFILLIDSVGEASYSLPETDMLVMAIFLILIFPSVYALYRYSFSMTELWGNENE